MVDETHNDEAQHTADAVDQVVQHTRDVGTGGGLDLLMNVALNLTVELGRCRMKISDIVNLGTGSVVELQKLASEPVDIVVNDALFARGEVVVLEDHFAVKLTELVDNPNLRNLG